MMIQYVFFNYFLPIYIYIYIYEELSNYYCGDYKNSFNLVNDNYFMFIFPTLIQIYL